MSDYSANAPKPAASNDAVQFPITPVVNADSADLADKSLSDLVSLARNAHQQRHPKSCFTLTTAILKIDPGHEEALAIQSWVRSILDEYMGQARTLIEEARSTNKSELYDRAEMIIDLILEVDQENEDAKFVMSEIAFASSLPARQPALAIPPEPGAAGVFPAPDPTLPSEALVPPERGSRLRRWLRFAGQELRPAGRELRPAVLTLLAVLVIGAGALAVFWGTEQPAAGTLDIGVDAGVQVFVNDEYRGVSPLQPLRLSPGTHRISYKLDGQKAGEEEVIVVAGKLVRNTISSFVGRVSLVVAPPSGVQLSVDGQPPRSVPDVLEVKPGVHTLAFSAGGHLPETTHVTVKPGDRRSVTVILRPAAWKGSAALVPPAAVPDTPGEATGSDEPEPAVVSSEPGVLAVSSLTSVDVFLDGTRVDSTPATLKLPPGTYTFEYRHQGLVKQLTHEIRSNYTTAVNVTFDVTVAIDATPFADVFIEESGDRRALGRTPLPGVTVSIGSVLVLRHSNFPEKKIRVGEADTTVKAVFP